VTQIAFRHFWNWLFVADIAPIFVAHVTTVFGADIAPVGAITDAT
jgi:hypothetical protein